MPEVMIRLDNKELVKWINKLYKEGNIKAFYNSKTIWRPKRTEILKRDNNECQECKKRGRYKRAENVHHIKHLREYPWLALVDSNLVSVCNDCHNMLHPEKGIYKSKDKKMINEEKW